MDELIKELSKHNIVYIPNEVGDVKLEIWFDKNITGGISALYSLNIKEFHFFDPDLYKSHEKLSEKEKTKFRNYLKSRFGIIIKTVS